MQTDRTCIKCSHVRVCGLQQDILQALVSHSHMIDYQSESGERLAAVLGSECKHFNPQPLDFKGGAS